MRREQETKCLTEEHREVTVGTFNTRGLKNMIGAVDEVSKDVAILGIGEPG